MKRRATLFPCSFIALILLCLPFSLEPAMTEGQKMKMEDGIPVIYNPKEPVQLKGAPSALTLRQDLVIGRASGDENEMFSELRAVQVDSEGNIYVLDGKEIHIRVFDKNGKHLRTFGKRGQGPGEIQMPIRMTLTPDGKLALLDNGNRKIAIFSPAGECLKEIPSAKWNLIRFRQDKQGQIYGDTFFFDEKGLGEKLLKFDPELNLLSTIEEIFTELRPPKVNPLPDRFVYDLMKGDYLIWGFTAKYELHILNPQGKLVCKIVKDYDPVRVSEKDKEKMSKERFGDKGSPPGVTLEWPANYPPIYTILADDQNRIFVRTYDRDARGWYYYDVFNPKGIFFLKFALAEEEIPMAIRNDKMYCLIDEGEEGVPQVKRYILEWK